MASSTLTKQDLAKLFKTHKRDVFGVAYYYLHDKDKALDLVMDTFEVLLKADGKKEIKNFKAWALGICRNLCLKKIRDSKRIVEIKESDSFFMENEEELEYSNEDIEKLNEGLQQLKEQQRTCIQLFYLENQSYEQISELTNFSYKEVKSHIQNGKRNLKNLLQKTK